MKESHPTLFPPLTDETWNHLIQDATATAHQLVTPLYWRGTRGGLLPHGYDAASIATQALLDALASLPLQPPDSPDNLELLAREIRRRVRQHVNRLQHLRENKLTRNDPDLALTLDDEGSPLSLIETIPASSPSPAQCLVDRDHEEQGTRFAAEFRTFLGRERRLATLFHCLQTGVRKPKDLARALQTRIRSVTNLKKRLRRRLAEFLALQSSAQAEIFSKNL